MTVTTEYSKNELSRSQVDALPGPVVLEFGNAWCGYCRRAEPLIREALQHHPGIRHIRIADASGQRVGRSFRVTLWPTLIFLKEGKEVSRLVRPTDPESLRQAVASIDSNVPGI